MKTYNEGSIPFKWCPQCRRFPDKTPSIAFYVDKRNADGLTLYCRACIQERNRKRSRSKTHKLLVRRKQTLKTLVVYDQELAI